MQFGSSLELEARIGRVCLVFARVEQEAGHVVQAADGNWDLAGSTAYLEYSSVSGALLDWLKDVSKAYPEVRADVAKLRDGLRALKRDRDEWAHSAAIVDPFLLMRESQVTSLRFAAGGSNGKLLNSKKAKHSDPPTDSDVDAFCARAAEVGDAAQAVALALARLVAKKGVRTVRGTMS
jgi:hypothetical protein